MVLATVKGDVHDIGKNLVDIILSNNGYRVVNLGIKQPADSIIQAAQQHRADAIGLSGLLVKSTLEMKYVIQDLERQALGYPVICGGAALTRKYVEDDLRREYSSAVFYAEDAFAGLHCMESLVGEQREQAIIAGRTVKEFRRPAASSGEETSATPRDAIPPAPNIPQPPFWGTRVCRDFDLREIFPYINETALFKNQWQLKTASQQDYLRLIEEKFRPILRQLENEVIGAGWFAPAVVYGFFPCQGEGNDLIIYDLQSFESRELRAGCAAPHDLREIVRFTFPRQREGRRLSITDYFLPRTSGRIDVVGMSVVTIGSGASVETQRLVREWRVHALPLSARAERGNRGGAGRIHRTKKLDEELGIAGDDAERISDLFHQKYQGLAGIRSAILPVRTWRTRRNCLPCSSPRRRSEFA